MTASDPLRTLCPPDIEWRVLEGVAVPMRTAEVWLRGEMLAHYEVRWHESDPPPTDEEMVLQAGRSALAEGVLAEEDADESEVRLGVGPDVR
jgi:hypothetical protein